MQTAKYQKKPIIVEAVQVTAKNFQDIMVWADGTAYAKDGTEAAEGEINPGQQFIHIKTHRPDSTRQERAYVGDYVLKTQSGFKIYKPRAFSMNFVLVEEAIEIVQATPQAIADVVNEQQPLPAEPVAPETTLEPPVAEIADGEIRATVEKDLTEGIEENLVKGMLEPSVEEDDKGILEEGNQLPDPESSVQASTPAERAAQQEQTSSKRSFLKE